MRYSGGSTALMEITDPLPAGQGGHLGRRYYGEQYFGSVVGAWEVDLAPATPEELEMWARRRQCSEAGCTVPTAPGVERCVEHSRAFWKGREP